MIADGFLSAWLWVVCCCGIGGDMSDMRRLLERAKRDRKFRWKLIHILFSIESKWSMQDILKRRFK